MPETQPAAAVYLRLCALADPARQSDNVRKKLAELIVAYHGLFGDLIKDIRPMLSAISSFKDLDSVKFSLGVYWIFERSAKLPRAEFEIIHNELQEAVAAIAEYFGQPNAATLAGHLTQAGGWYWFRRLSFACVEFAEVDKGLFSPGFVEILERFSLLCPDTYDDIDGPRDFMRTLRELTGQSPHIEVISGPGSGPTSRPDS